MELKLKNLLTTLASRDESEGALGRHSLMLVSLIVLLAALPLGHALTGGGTRFPVLLALVVTAAVFVNIHQGWAFVVALLIGTASVAGIGYAEYSGSDAVRISSEILGLSVLGFTTLIMFNSLLQADCVSLDTIVGGICVYLLVGLCFAMVYLVLIEFEPGSILRDGEAIVRSAADSSAHATTLLYFSFVTLTTLGYGDVSPRGDMAEMFAVSEAVVGQLYLAIFVARLVALYVVRDRELRP